MANADVNRLMDNLRVRLPGAVDTALQMELFNALTEFFMGSNIWRENIEIYVVPDVTNYDLTPMGNAKVVRLMSVEDNNKFPVSASIDLITQELALAQAPANAATYVAQVALSVDDPVDKEGYPQFPAWVLSVYQSDIIDGVLARMMSQPAKPYSNTQLAIYHERRFASAIAMARAEAQRRYVYGGQTWRFPQSFNRRKTYR